MCCSFQSKWLYKTELIPDSNRHSGDRFWYENGDHPGAFTPAQLQEIRKVSLARIVCDNLDNIDNIQPYVFISHIETSNLPRSCRGSAIPEVDLNKWKENSDGEFESGEDVSVSVYDNILKIIDLIEPTTGREKKFSGDLPKQISRKQYYEFFENYFRK